MFDLLWVPNLIKIGANFSAGSKFAQILAQDHQFQVLYSLLAWSICTKCQISKKLDHIAILRPNLSKFLISGQDPQFSNIISKINELSLFWVLNFIALRMYFIFGTKFSWNKGIDTCFNIECVLLAHNFDYFGGYFVVAACYCSLPGGYWWLLLVTGSYCSLPLVTARSHF